MGCTGGARETIEDACITKNKGGGGCEDCMILVWRMMQNTEVGFQSIITPPLSLPHLLHVSPCSPDPPSNPSNRLPECCPTSCVHWHPIHCFHVPWMACAGTISP